MKNNILVKIRIKKADEMKGFGIIMNENKHPVYCLPNNEYIVEDNLLKILRKKKIRFTELE